MQKGIPCDQCPSCCWLWLEVCIYIIYIYFVTAANYQKSCKCYCTSINMIIYMFIKTNVWTILCILSIFRFTNAVCKFPGSTHDAYILQNSEIQYEIMGLRDGGWILRETRVTLLKNGLWLQSTTPGIGRRKITIEHIVEQEMWWKGHLVCWKPVSGIQYVTYLYIFITLI